jgi:tetratricopeptide (TPR) repeat protein
VYVFQPETEGQPMGADAEELGLWFLSARQLANSGEIAKAIEAYSQALNLCPGHIRARFGRGMAKQRLAMHQEAIIDFDDVIASRPDWAGLWAVLYCRAVSRFACGQYLESVKDCTESLARNSNQCDAYYMRGKAHKELGELQAALTDMEQVIALDPNYWEAYLLRCSVFVSKGQWELAYEDLNFLKHLPNLPAERMPEVLFMRALVARSVGEIEVAIQDYTEIIRLTPSDARAYLRRSMVLRESGRSREADEDFVRGRELAGIAGIRRKP